MHLRRREPPVGRRTGNLIPCSAGQKMFGFCAVPTVRRESPMLSPAVTVRWGDDGAESIPLRATHRGERADAVPPPHEGCALRWSQELLMGVQRIAVWAPANAGRALSFAPDCNAQVKYDGDILHIIKQYPGCDDTRVLAFLRARVHWFGRGTLI